MRFLLDENVDQRVGPVLAAGHEVRRVVNVLGSGATDAVVRRYAKAEGCILVTGDKRFAFRMRDRHEQPCLFLHGLLASERERVRELLAAIESEARAGGDRFWMEIRPNYFLVKR